MAAQPALSRGDALAADVVVLGGGFAGLSAATSLAERGRRVLVLEARPNLGGRATSFVDPATGERVDNGQHLLIGGYHETFRFLRRIGSLDAVRLQPGLSVDIIDAGGARTRLQSVNLPAPLHLAGGIARWPALGWRDRVAALGMGGAIRAAHQARPQNGKGAGNGAGRTIAARTVRQWLVSSGQTNRLIELLWEPLAVASLNESIDVAAPGPFAEVLARMFGKDRRDSALAVPLKPLDEMYTLPARAFIESHGGQVAVNAAASIAAAPALHVRRRHDSGSADLTALQGRCVICAVPWFALPDVLADVPALHETIAAARATPASPIVTVNLWLDRPVTGGDFVGLPGRSMQWVFDKRAIFGDNSSHLSLVSSAATDLVGRSNTDIIERALTEMRAAFPLMRDAEVRRAIAVREKRATFSVAAGLPPRPQTQTAIPGLFLAGDWIDTGLPATIEGAVISGHAAADAAAAFLHT